MKSILYSFDLPAVEIDEARFRRDGITLVLRIASHSCKCPLCGMYATRVHSFYSRRLADLPWLGTPVAVLWRSRRFFCDNSRCARKIFTERCPKIVAPYGRRTSRLCRALRSLALACGGESASRVAQRIGMPASGDTLLRLIRKFPPSPSVTPRVLGVDDWAICRGQRYGTILCDLERHCVVDLLPERSADSFADWLKRHAGIEVISCDRGDVYIRGATDGAPEAVQVADRWHLIKNLHDALVRILDRHGRDVQSAARDVAVSESIDRANRHVQKGNSLGKPQPKNARLQLVERHRQSRLRQYKKILKMRQRGLSFRAIARQLGLHRSTVRRYAEALNFPERQQRPYTRGTDAFDGFLRHRWEEGCRNAKQLTRELVDRGFKGSYYMVMRRVRGWREFGSGRAVDNCTGVRTHRMTSRRAAWVLLRSAEERSEIEQAFATALCDRCPPIATVRRLAQEFRSMMTNHDGGKLNRWLLKADTTELTNFAKSLSANRASVRAGIDLPWSNGQTEGQVNRLKTLKRQMYGRANIDLLRSRMLAEQTVFEVAS